ncbi:MAG: hypothetical protein WC916_03625 [Candidatus Woesearchaeota archaeon]
MDYNIKNLYDTSCLKIAGVVGTGIHLYSAAINSQHFEGIYQDFATGHLIGGTLKATVPFILPYCVSFYARRKAQKEFTKKISDLENKIEKTN